MRMLVSDMAGRASIELKARELGLDLAGQDELLAPVLGRGQGPRAARVHLRRRRRVVRAAAARARCPARRRPTSTSSRGASSPTPRRRRGRRLRGHRQAASPAAAGSSPPARATARSTRSTTRCGRRSPTVYPEIDKLELIDFRVRILDASHGTDAVTRVLIETSDGETSWNTLGRRGQHRRGVLEGPRRRDHLRAAPARGAGSLRVCAEVRPRIPSRNRLATGGTRPRSSPACGGSASRRRRRSPRPAT